MAGRCRHCLEGPRNAESLLPLAIVSLASLDTLPLWGRSYSDPSAAPLSQQVSGSFYFPLLRSLAAFTHWYVSIRAFRARLCVSVLNNRISRVAVTAAAAAATEHGSESAASSSLRKSSTMQLHCSCLNQWDAHNQLNLLGYRKKKGVIVYAFWWHKILGTGEKEKSPEGQEGQGLMQRKRNLLKATQTAGDCRASNI